jgi:hypothetical protein
MREQVFNFIQTDLRQGPERLADIGRGPFPEPAKRRE